MRNGVYHAHKMARAAGRKPGPLTRLLDMANEWFAKFCNQPSAVDEDLDFYDIVEDAFQDPESSDATEISGQCVHQPSAAGTDFDAKLADTLATHKHVFRA